MDCHGSLYKSHWPVLLCIGDGNERTRGAVKMWSEYRNTDQFGPHKYRDLAISLDLAGYPDSISSEIPYPSHLYIYAFSFYIIFTDVSFLKFSSFYFISLIMMSANTFSIIFMIILSMCG